MNSKLLVAVLTKDEEENIGACLDSVVSLACRVLVVDSGSSDKTVAIAEEKGAEVVFHPFESISRQRNWVIENYGKDYDWILFLDADERVSKALAAQLETLHPPAPGSPCGYYVPRHFYFMGRRLEYGGVRHNRVLRLVHPARSKILEQTRTLEYAKVDGPVGALSGAIEHENRKPLSDWIKKHDWYSTREAEDQIAGMGRKPVGASENPRFSFINSLQTRFVPPLLRPFLTFVYSYFFRLGFLDGKEGFIYAILHDFWYPLLTAAKIYELRSDERLRTD